MTYREESFTCRVCGMTSYNPNDVKHRYCGNCHEFTENELGFISAVLRRATGLTSVSMEQANGELRSIQKSGATLERWKTLMEKWDPRGKTT